MMDALDQSALKWPLFPYPGLRPFRISPEGDESLIFYGRATNKDDVLERLNLSQFVSVVGPSGCGKSSLVKVGVIPALLAGLLTRAGYDWEEIQMRPGQDPLGNLTRALFRLRATRACTADMTEEQIGALLSTERSALWALMEYLSPAPSPSAQPRRVLLLIDQFEEIFSGIQDNRAVDTFVGLITQFFRRPHPRLYIILTMRTDFIGQCANFPGLAEILNKTQYITPVLRGQDLKDAITRAAEAYGGDVEPALTSELMRDMGSGSTYQADHLPLMQHALLWLWQRACQRCGLREPPKPGADLPEKVVLTLADYEEHGRLHGILDRHAEEIHARAIAGGDSARRTEIAEIMLRRLSERDAGLRYKRSPAHVSEICQLAGCTSSELRVVFDPFTTSDASFAESRDNPTDPLLDFSHESLIRQWRRLRAWTDQEAEKVVSFRKFAGDAKTWAQENKESAYLKTGRQLGDLQDWWRQNRPTATWARRYGADDGKAGQLSDRLELVEEFRTQSQRAETRRKRLSWAGLVALPVVVCALVGAFFFNEQRIMAREEVKNRLTAAFLQGREELRRGHATKALQIALGYLDDLEGKFDQLDRMEDLALKALQGLRQRRIIEVDSILAFDYSPDGRWLVGLGEYGHTVWDAAGKPHQVRASDRRFRDVRWSPSGDRLLFSAPRGKPALLVEMNQSDGKQSGSKELGDDKGVGFGIFSLDGSRVATGGNGVPLRVWRADTGELLAEQVKEVGEAYGFSRALAFSSDHALIAIAGRGGDVEIYRVDSRGRDIRKLTAIKTSNEQLPPAVRSLAFHPKDPTALLFAQGDRIGILKLNLDDNPEGSVSGVPSILVDMGKDKLTELPELIVYQVTFNSDGTLFAAAVSGGGAYVWQTGLSGKTLHATFKEHVGRVTAIAFNPVGKHIATAGREDRKIRIWTIEPILETQESNSQVRFADRKALLAFARNHLPRTGSKEVELTAEDRCLVGLDRGAKCER